MYRGSHFEIWRNVTLKPLNLIEEMNALAYCKIIIRLKNSSRDDKPTNIANLTYFLSTANMLND